MNNEEKALFFEKFNKQLHILGKITLIIAMIALVIFVLVVAVTKYVSLGSICGALSFAIMKLCIGGHNSGFYAYLFALALFIVFMHRKNVVRLIKGTENKISSRKK